MVSSTGRPSYFFWALATSALTVVGTITPRTVVAGVKGPSNFMPNQLPNSVESDNARQTRLRGARRRIFFSMRLVLMRNLQVAYKHSPSGNATIGLRNARAVYFAKKARNAWES